MLYKNVDICDLESILKKGILSLDECGNDNWSEGRRADNACDVVYMFKPKNKNCLHMYGLALLEIKEGIGERQVEFAENDSNAEYYDEYVVEKVNPDNIVNIYLPTFLKNRIEKDLEDEVLKKITWVQFKAYRYSEEETDKCLGGTFLTECSEFEYGLMQREECTLNSCYYNFFRGFDGRMLICDYELLEYAI